MSIKKGDLVMVSSAMNCCGTPTGAEGMFFVVTNLSYSATDICSACNARLPPVAAEGCAGKRPIGLTRLKKIDPPSTGELDGVPVRKEVEAPIKGIPEEAVSK